MKRRILTYIESLRFPFILLLAGLLLAVNLLIPDPIPFVDEILLALATIILSRLRRRRPEAEPEPSESAASEKSP